MRAFIRFAAAALVLLGGPVASQAMSFNLELRELLPAENPAARHVYTCNACTLEQFNAVPLPGPNWEKNATDTSARLFLPDSGTNTPPVLDPSVATGLDLIAEIPGDEFQLIAKVLSAGLVGLTSEGPTIQAQVARGTTLNWNAGRVIHKAVSPTGDEYVLFSIDEAYSLSYNLDAVNGVAGLPLPAGWSYTSELLTSGFTVDTPTGVATVIAVAAGAATWQRIVVPEPGLATLVLAALVFLAVGRRPTRG